MTEERVEPKDSAQALIFLRNEFYRKKYYLLLSVFCLGLFVMAVLAGMLSYLLKHPTHPLYFVTDSAGRFIQEVPGKQANMTTDEVAAWTVSAIEQAYSYDYINYRAQLQDAQKYFTDYGWHSYMKGLQSSNNLLALTQRKMVVIAKVVSPPKLIVQGVMSTAYAWKFELPLLVTYINPPYSATSRFSNALLISVIVQRQNVLSSYKGLGIVQMIASSVSVAPAGIATPS